MNIYEFRALYPDFDCIDDATIQVQLDLFISIYGSGYGSLVDHLQGLYAAHKLFIKGQNNSGPIASRSVGDVSVTYSDKVTSDSQLYTSSYGTEFAQIISGFSSPILQGV